MTGFISNNIGRLLANVERHAAAQHKTIIWIRQPVRVKGRWMCWVRLEAV